MVEVDQVVMDYPVPKRYRELLTAPFSKPKVKRALNGVSLNIPSGERIAFLGPNGAGKTTLLKLIGGLLLPTRGTVKVNGYDTLKKNEEARSRVSFVNSEERSFYWRLTARENLEFFGVLDDLQGQGLKRRIQEVLEFVNLVDAADLPVGGFSSGMKQRLGLARGLLSDPEILILDEPTRALDPLAAQELTNFLVQDLSTGLEKTLLVATHRLEEATEMCRRFCLVNHGTITQDADLDQVKTTWGGLKAFYEAGVVL